MRNQLVLVVWFLATLLLCAEAGNVSATVQQVKSVGATASLSSRLAALDIESQQTISFLEEDEQHSPLKVSRTFVDHITGAQDEQMPKHLALMKSVFQCIAYCITACVLLALYSMFLSWFVKDANSSSMGVVGLATWFVFLASSIFVALTSLIMYGWNDVFSLVISNLEKIKGSLNVSPAAVVQSGTTTSHATKLASTVLIAISSSLSSMTTTKGISFAAEQTQPVLCKLAYSKSSPASNRYPPGHAWYMYNMRRMGDTSGTEDSPELDYARTLVTTNGYTGGLTNKMTQFFGGVSNQCEEENGNVEACCDPANCALANNPQQCIEQRCPGRVIEEKGDDHCQCLEVMNKMNLHIEHQQLTLCGAHVRDLITREVEKLFGEDVTMAALRDAALTKGCADVYEAQNWAITGPFVKVQYATEGTLDASAFPGTFFIEPTQDVTVNDKVEVSWTGCNSGVYEISLRYENESGSPITLGFNIDGAFNQDVSFPVTTNGFSSKTFTVDASVIAPGDHKVEFFSKSSDFPRLHRLAVAVTTPTS